jgi:hypothetical protein
MKDMNMKEHTDRVSGAHDEIAISIEANAVAFFAQISGLAKDKIGYPIRELSTNAWDASRGRFEVHLPTSINPIFRVRDFGPGMSHDDMINVYARLYASTKRSNTEEVGGWGLGSKSPYAYLIGDEGTGSYTVNSYREGMIRSYVLSLSAKGSPVMRLMFEGESDQEPGLEVMFPVRRGDIQAFHERAKTILWSFSPRPRITPELVWDEPTIIAEGDGWKQYGGNVPFFGPQVRMGPVMYAVDVSVLDKADFLAPQDAVVFDIPIGSVSVTVSRESLSYDPRTRAFLKDLISRYEQSYVDVLQAKIDASEDFLGACRNLSTETTSFDGTRRKFLRNKVTFRGRDIPELINIPATTGKTMVLADGWTPRTYEKFAKESLTFNAWGNSRKKFEAVAVEHNPNRSFERLKAAGLEGKNVLWVRASRVDLDEVLDHLGNPAHIVLDDIKLDKLPRGEKRKKTIRRRKVISLSNFNIRDLSTEDVDMEEGGFYVCKSAHRYNRSTVYIDTNKHVQDYHLTSLLSKCVELGVIDTNSVIILSREDEALGDNWEWLGPHLNAGLAEKVDVSQFDELLDISVSQMGNDLRNLTRDQNFSNAPDDLRQLVNDVRALKRRIEMRVNQSSNTDIAYQTLKSLGYSFDVPNRANPITALQRKWDELERRYSLLSYLLGNNGYWHDVSRQQQDRLNHYFELLKLLPQDDVVEEDIQEAA